MPRSPFKNIAQALLGTTVIPQEAPRQVEQIGKQFSAGLFAGGAPMIQRETREKIGEEFTMTPFKSDLMMQIPQYKGLAEEWRVVKEELAASKVHLSQIQNRIVQSKTELEKIQADLNKSRHNLDTIQSELTTIQGQVALSKVELESIRNVLNDSRNDLDTLANQNAQAIEQ